MYRIYSAGIEVLAAAVFLVPLFCLYGVCLCRDLRRTLLYFVFACYLAAVLALVGFPNVTACRLDVSLNLIPFLDMVSDARNACLNVLLFLPFGFFLPLLWETFRSAKRTLAAGLAATLFIEAAQLFTLRTTDINDIFTNLCGTLLGYCIAKALTKGFTRRPVSHADGRAFLPLCGVVVLVMVFLQPFAAALLWDAVL